MDPNFDYLTPLAIMLVIAAILLMAGACGAGIALERWVW